MLMPRKVYAFGTFPLHFGDRWSFVQYVLRQSEMTSQAVHFNTKYPGFDYDGEVLELASHLDSTGTLVPTSSRAYVRPSIGTTFRSPTVFTKRKWSGEDRGLVCYQFDGRYLANLKNLSPDEETEVFERLAGLGYRVENLGGMRPLGKIIELLSRAAFFVGVSSGISHVAISVGLPVHVILNKISRPWHEHCLYFNKPVTLYDDSKQFLQSLGGKRVLANLDHSRRDRPHIGH